ncbi:amino acid ABC transporter permease [Cutibacterium avidum]|uniref:amino acid ABC transporter permease n=1 Tax=Cutibacterium avidum TaxID=33010 RepID=UPI00254E6AA2|nr:amino acid ABC transporter permease [Cutibacterium avidum]MBS5745753.1 amino acid ABC transporter permease [Propionibacterium sp.]MDK7358851.1 amino acid ABC transporter permease [Cutibacterium avidum]MDK7371800.1 amino acid ABC transporter permease [Cutibacterium avidum]MDU3749342.1 amino acid ABC transporter permease [Cutibacterium avidum]MDU4206938.1 amino acid ABC transporter permease [Cutibacterium avidum]
MQPLLDPQTWVLLLQGLWVSVRIALVSMVLSIMLAIPLGLVMDSRHLWLRILTRGYVEALRLLPQLVLLFVVYFDMAQVAGLDVSGEVAAIIVFTLWGTAEMGDLVRGAIAAVPHHQIVSAQALGMSDRAVRRHIVMPLALRQLVPLTVNLVTRMIKTTALVSLIGVVEILKVTQAIIDRNRFDHPDAALWIYGTVFCLYFVVCFVISLYSRHLERKMALS